MRAYVHVLISGLLIITLNAGCSGDSTGKDSSVSADLGAQVDTGAKSDSKAADQGVDASGECVVPCDCPEGKTCLNWKCIAGPVAHACCNRADCPEASPCELPGGEWDLCPSSAECKSHCDCDQGTPCAGGYCIPDFTTRYCCTKPGCPTGASCENPDKSEGTCP